MADETAGTAVGRRARLFLSYASADDEHRIELEKHLVPLVREGLIELWSDRKILIGDRWEEEIDRRLDRADIFIALVTADFLASNYIDGVEMKRALQRRSERTLQLLPVLVDSCAWEQTAIAELQVLPDRAQPIVSWPSRAEAWTEVVKAVRHAALAGGSKRQSEHEAAAAAPPDPTDYLQDLLEQHSYVEIRGMGAQVSERLPLDVIYTRLHVTTPHREKEREDHADRSTGPRREREPMAMENSNRELREVLVEHQDVALIGDPGSGKTTFLRYVAQNLALAQLGEPDALRLPGKALLPIFVRVERLASFLSEFPDPKCEDDAPEHFYRYLDHLQQGQAYALPDTYLRERVCAGGCMLLLDGLDEVPGAARRERLARLIEKVVTAGGRADNRHLITCRTRAWEGRVQLGGRTVMARLAPFGRAEVEHFCDGWSRALFRAMGDAAIEGSPARAQAERYRVELLGAVDANPEGRRFASSPLMLTVLAVVHWTRRKLPEQRAELYDAAVEYLLESRSKLTSRTPMLRREGLQAIAFEMFTHEAGVQRSLGRRDAARAAMSALGVDEKEAIAFVEDEELYSGLLVSRSEGEVEFWHLLFQEYLAALEISQREEGGFSIVREHLGDDRWSEVVLLLAGCRRRQGLRAASELIEQILSQAQGRALRVRAVVGRLLRNVLPGELGPFRLGQARAGQARAVGLVGRILRDILPYGGDPSEGTGYAVQLAQTLSIFEPGGEQVDEDVRIEVGEALGQAGDPRLVDPEALKVRVPGGTFVMGAQKTDRKEPHYDAHANPDEAPPNERSIPDLQVGRYPVTVGEFRGFVDAKERGYDNPSLWLPEGWALRPSDEIPSPRNWGDQLQHPNRPVVSVSWYEAQAYCRWVGGRLPSEAEWEWLARGAEGRRYPWGSEPPGAERAAFDGRREEPAPVGSYPLGATPLGVCDLAGNVLEWCEDAWRERYDAEPERRRVLRGGAFNGSAGFLRGAYRIIYAPELRNCSVGFRVVWSLAGAQDFRSIRSEGPELRSPSSDDDRECCQLSCPAERPGRGLRRGRRTRPAVLQVVQSVVAPRESGAAGRLQRSPTWMTRVYPPCRRDTTSTGGCSRASSAFHGATSLRSATGSKAPLWTCSWRSSRHPTPVVLTAPSTERIACSISFESCSALRVTQA